MNTRSRKTSYSRNKRRKINQRIGRESAKSVRDRREQERIAGGRHRIDISERELIEASRLNTGLSGVTAIVNAQMQTPEAWERVWADTATERRR